MRFNRRRFVQGLVSAGALAAFNWELPSASAETSMTSVLTGKEFELTIDTLPVNFTGRSRLATAVNGSLPGPTLRWREGDTVTVSVTNRLKTTASIHWHGMRIPAEMDGVPGLSFAGIAPGRTFVYRFPVKQSGTYWYHSHSGFEEQTGLLGALIIEPRNPDPIAFDREYIVLLTDWTDEEPHSILSNLKQESDYYNYHRLTFPNFLSDAKKKGFRAALSNRMMWAKMNMSPTDIADVSGSTYTYLLNGAPPNRNWTGLFQPGEKLRLRFINGSSMSFFDVRIPGLPMTVVEADGNAVAPVTVDEFRIGTAETYDVVVKPQGNAAYTIFAQAEDRTGFARGTLAPRAGLTAVIPPMDPRPMRTMADMGMDMKRMKGMSGMGEMKGMDMNSANDMHNMPEMEMSSMQPMEGTDGNSKSSIKLYSDSSKMNSSHDRMADMPGMAMSDDAAGRTPLPQPGPGMTPIGRSEEIAMHPVDLRPSNPVHLHTGPEVVQVSAITSEKLHDPGAGLQNNGRRVLTYADLRARYRGVDRRPPTREIELHLTGSMQRYIWGFNGKKFSEAPSIQLKLGERVRFVVINDTMMEHPIHLHGLWSELENGHGEFNPYKHTVIVKPSESVSYLISADTPGEWAYHCHLIFHMESGMFRKVAVS
jgi:CopA family copper-resistance protein